MNNKVLARIVAAVMAVMMLGTLAFADATYTNGTIDSTLDSAYEAQTIYTLLAYKADSANDVEIADADIIAIEQSNDINKIKTITVDTTKVNTRYIKVLYGGNGSVTKSATIDLQTTAPLETITISALSEGQGHGKYEINGQKFSNVVKVVYTFAAEGKTITKVGVEFKGTAAAEFTTADDVTIPAGTETGAKIEKAVNISGDGSVEFAAYLFGVPAADAATMIAVPFIQYY